MFINAIRFRSVTENQLKVWRFNQGRGNFSNFLCFCGDYQTICDMRAAINYAITGKTNPRIWEVAVQLSDDGGDSWVVERTPSKFRVLHNNNLVAIDTANTALLTALLDADESTIENGIDLTRAISNFEISNESDLYAKRVTEGQTTFSKISSVATQNIKNLAEQCKGLFGIEQFLDPKTVIDLRKKIEPLYSTLSELRKQHKDLLSEVESFSEFDSSIITRLTGELELIKEIEEAAGPLLEPGVSPKSLTENLQKIETDLSEELKACNLRTMPLTDEGIAWHKLASALCKLETYEKLIQASEKARDFRSGRLEPIYDEYFKTLENVLTNDSQITAELESCLTTLTVYLETEANKSRKKKSITKLFNNFVHPPESREDSLEAQQEKQAKLENSRMSVDYALGRLGELHSNLSVARKDFDEFRNKLDEANEALISEYGKLKSHWLKLTKENNIPEEIDLPRIMRLVTRYAHLSELWHKKQTLRTTLADRKSRLDRLEALVLEWRRLTGSQKDTLSSTQAILISETQSILRYKEKKEQQLNKLKDLAERLRAFNVLRTHIEGRQLKASALWQRALNDLALPVMDPSDSKWPEFFSLARTIETWNKVIFKEQKPLIGREMFSIETHESPIALYLWKSNSIENKDRLEFLRIVESKNTNAFSLILTADQKLSEMLISLGVGTARQIEKQQAGAQANVRQLKPVVPNRVQEVLNILTKPTITKEAI